MSRDQGWKVLDWKYEEYIYTSFVVRVELLVKSIKSLNFIYVRYLNIPNITLMVKSKQTGPGAGCTFSQSNNLMHHIRPELPSPRNCYRGLVPDTSLFCPVKTLPPGSNILKLSDRHQLFSS